MTESGMLQYTLPSFSELHGVSIENIAHLDWVSYMTSVASYDEMTSKTTIL